MAYYPNLPAGQAKMTSSAPVVIASDQTPVSINVSTDAFEQLVVGSRYNQVEVSFATTDPDLITDITVTKSNGGDASNANGVGVFTSGTNTSGGIKAVTNTSVIYSPHFETYAAFSAIFTPGIANSYQRIGIYNDSNGFFVGYNNTVFGVTLRKGGIDTFVGQTSFNGDLLDGSAGSKFLRNGVPEAVDFTKDNLFRIRFGWLGAAPITFEILSPDCDWIAFHAIKFPNTSTSASINDPNLPITLDIQKTTAGATSLSIATGCWGAGTTSDFQKLSSTVTDSTLARVDKSVITAKTPGGSYINVGATASNNLRTAISEVAAGAVFPVSDNGGSLTVDGNVTISGTVAVTDNNGSLTVDGTVAATQSGTWNITNISGTVSLPTGAATAANQATEITALQLLDDVVATDGSAALTKLYQVGGTDGTNAQILSTNTSGHLNIADGGNSITVDGTVAATQSGTWNINNISGTVSLPTGAATETTLSALNTKIPSNLTVTSTRLLVDGSGVTQPVSGTITVQDGGGSITVDGSVSVSNFPATQTVSGTVELGSTSLAALESITVSGTVAATQSGTWATRTQDGSGNAVTSHVAGSSRGIDVSIIDGSGNQITSFGGGTQYTEGDVDATITGTAMLWEDTSDTLRAVSAAKPLPVNIVAGAGSGTEYADGTTVATPTGAAALGWDGTAVQVVRTDSSGVLAIQDNGGSITVDGSVSVSGTVEIGATSLAALESITVQNGAGASAVNIQDGGNSITVDGTVTANAGTGTFNTSDANAVSQSTATASQKGYLSLAGVTATLPTYTAGNTNAMTMTTNGLLRVDGSNVTQPVSGTVTADTELPTAAALADGAANPTAPTVGAAALGFNGTTWDRLRSEGTTADGESGAASGSLSTCAHGELYNGATWDRMRAANALDGTGATSHTGVLAVLQPNKRFNPTNLATAANSTSVIDINGANSARVAIGTTTTGTFTFEVTADGSTWVAAEVYATGGDNWLSGQNITPTSGQVYTVLIGSWRALRLRTVTTLGATVAHFVTLSMSQAVISAIDTGFAPHAIGYSFVNKSGEYSTTQTGVALWTPTTGRKFVVTDFTISTGGTTSGIVTIWQGASADTTYTAGTDPVLFRGEFAPSATVKPGVVKTLNMPFVSSTTDHILKVTTSAAMTIYVQVNGYEIV